MTARSAGSEIVLALVALLVVLFICVAPTLAQTSGTGGLTGTVTDPSDAVISGATVTATNLATGQSRTVTTDATGTYTLSLLPVGAYRVTFSAEGFKTIAVRSVTVNVTEVPMLNQSLSVGPKSEQITVSTTGETLQTQNATIGRLVGSKEITDLPLSTRNYTQVVALSPGVVANVPSAAAIGNGTQDANVNGSSSDQNNYMMDGASITNYGGGSAAKQGGIPGIGIPNPDSIQEFKIQTGQYDAAYGRNPGASVDIVTKSGTNAFHGAAWEFFRNDALNANDFFLKNQQLAAGVPNKPQTLKQNQFGGALGGPIEKDKLFFFGSYQGTRQINALGTNGFVRGFSTGVSMPQFNNPCGNRSDGCNGQTYRQYLGSVFGGEMGCFFGLLGTCVPVAADGSNINQVAINILQAPGPKSGFNGGYYVPSGSYVPPHPGVCLAPCLTSIVDPVRANEDQFLVNTDYIISGKHTLTEKYFFSSDPQVQSFVCFAQCMPGAPADVTYTAHDALLKLTSVFANNLVNEARLSYQRQTLNGTDDITVKACDVGMIPMVSNSASCPAPANAIPEFYLLPAIAIASLNGFGSNTAWGEFQFGGNYFASTTSYFNVFQFADQISWNHGKHSIRAGFEAERTQWNYTTPGYGRGFLVFGNIADFLTSGSGTPGTNCGVAGAQPCPAFAGNGILANLTLRLAPDNPSYHAFRANAFSSFVQDDIKVSPQLILNFGLRWEYNGFPSDATGMLTNVWTTQAALNNTGSYFLNNPTGTLLGFVVPSNYNANSTVCGGSPCGYTAPNGATGVYTNTNKTLVHGSPVANFAPRIGLAWQPISDRFVIRAGYGIFYDRIYGYLLGGTQAGLPPYAGSAGSSFTQTLDNPFTPGTLGWTPRTLSAPVVDPTYGAIVVAGSDFAGSSYTGSSNSISESMGTPMVQAYNLNFEYKFASNWVAEVGYVGTHGTHLHDFGRSINVAHLVAGAPNGPTDAQNSAMVTGSGHRGTPAALPFNDANNTEPIRTNLISNVQGRVTYLGIDPAGLSTTSTAGDHLYNSLQAVLKHSFSQGLLLQVSYTWSKLITNVNADQSGGGIAQPGNILSGGAGSNNVLDLRQQYGLAVFNRSQRLVISYGYDLPSKYTTGLNARLLDGWSVSGVTTVQNGQPFTVVDDAAGTIYWGANGSAYLNQLPRATLGDPVNCNSLGVCQSGIPVATSGSVKSRLGGYINSNAFAPPPCIGGIVEGDCFGSGGGTGFGNSGVGILTGPGQFNWDISIQKQTKVSDQVNLIFRTEFYNAFNHAQFNPPNNDFAAFNPNPALNQFGVITSSSVPPRVVQFGLKVLF